MSSDTIVTLLLGNKCDTNERRVVTQEEGARFADANNILFLETSAKDNTNVERAFEQSARNVIQLIKSGKLVVVNKKPQSPGQAGSNQTKVEPGSLAGEKKKDKCC
eukprot:gene1166-1336_t